MLIIKPYQLGKCGLDTQEMLADLKACHRFGPCGIGEKAIYLNSMYIERRYYVPFTSVTRVFKRVAMSKGGFSGNGVFASVPYLVVEYDDGQQKQCTFKREEQVDQLLDYLKKTHPDLKLHSEAAEKRLREKACRLKERRARIASAKAKEEIGELERASKYLEMRPQLYRELSAASKAKRSYERSNPAYKWVALAIVLMGAAAFIYGVYSLITHAGSAMYFLLFGLAAIFLFSGANVLPTSKNNHRAIEKRLADAEQLMENYLASYEGFPTPARYAHPGVLARMVEVMAYERADNLPKALEVVKEDLKALNSSVTVEQEEYDEIMAIKPLFLVHDYE
ncbi:MAG: ATPase P [Eubacteriales bacterium]|nr:ATPase P [Eubacteriales bacterium]